MLEIYGESPKGHATFSNLGHLNFLYFQIIKCIQLPDQYLRLSELTFEINRTISDRFAGRKFWVMADVTSHLYKPDKRNHFFELVEKDPVSGSLLAKLSAKAWGGGSQSIEHFQRTTGQRFTSNISVLICVEVQYHAEFGLQANLLQIDVTFTLGALEQQRRQTLERLVSLNPGVIWKIGEKYFTRNNQLHMPRVLQRIALIASKTSAGAEDLRHTLQLNRHGYQFFLDEYHAPVQGDEFAVEIVQQLVAIYKSGKTYDVVVITRGGGSQADLLIFDNYDLARAIARFPIPVITGIGHQRNESIVDWMAHTSTKTPTKAAEFILAHNRKFEEQMLIHQHTIIIRAQQQFAREAEKLSGIYSKIITHSNRALASRKELMNRINQIVTGKSTAILFKSRKALVNSTSSLLSRPWTIIGNQDNNLKNISSNLKIFNAQYLKNQRGYLQHYQSLVQTMSPLNILNKGFAIVKTGEKIYTGNNNLKLGDKLEIVMSASRISAIFNGKSDQYATDANI